MRFLSDWSSDVCSSDLALEQQAQRLAPAQADALAGRRREPRSVRPDHERAERGRRLTGLGGQRLERTLEASQEDRLAERRDGKGDEITMFRHERGKALC